MNASQALVIVKDHFLVQKLRKFTFPRTHPEAWQVVCETTSYMDKWNPDIDERIYHFLNGYSDYPLCPVCNDWLPFINRTQGYYETCSQGCHNKKVIFDEKPKLFRNQESEEFLQALIIRHFTVINKSKKEFATWYPTEYKRILERTSYMDEWEPNFSERCSHVLHDLRDYPTCPQCGNWNNFVRLTVGYTEYCGRACAGKAEASIQKGKETNLERYGATVAANSKEYQEARVAAHLAEHGVEWSTQTPEFKEKFKQTSKERYGVDHPTQLEEVQQKKIATNIERYGVEHVSQAAEIKTKTRQRFIEKWLYATSASQLHLSKEVLEKLNDPDWLRDQYEVQNKVHAQIAEELGVAPSTISFTMIRHGIEVKRQRMSSRDEQELARYILEWNPDLELILNSRRIIRNPLSNTAQELDIVIPEKNLAFEFNGIFWHSTYYDTHYYNPKYHQNKYLEAKKAGYNLITIFEDEWWNSWSVLERKLKVILGTDDSKKVYARKCSIVSPDAKTRSTFYQQNHIQGNGRGHLCYGLEYEGELVACFLVYNDGEGIWKLDRYATSCNVVGGFSKLLSHFKKNAEWKSLYTFADLRFSDHENSVYLKSGFQFDYITDPNYFYLVEGKRMPRQAFMKHKLPNLLENFDPELNEEENMRNHNYYRIYDCGNAKYTLKNSKYN